MDILDKKGFGKMVEELVKNHSLTYIDSVLTICKERGIDPSETKGLISPIIKSKIEAEAMEERKLRGSPKHSLKSFTE